MSGYFWDERPSVVPWQKTSLARLCLWKHRTETVIQAEELWVLFVLDQEPRGESQAPGSEERTERGNHG